MLNVYAGENNFKNKKKKYTFHKTDTGTKSVGLHSGNSLITE